MSRYDETFAGLAERGEGALVPFLVLGDPDLDTSRRLLRALVSAGADALELGLPFSDPVADGPTLQAAAGRALPAGATPPACLELVRELRAEFPDLPLGLLVYANLVECRGAPSFYGAAAGAGLDSVLVADVPALEALPFCAAARAAGIDPILMAAPGTPPATLAQVAELGAGHTYCVARRGVTGADDQVRFEVGSAFEILAARGAPPPLLGFGISSPEHVRAALAIGAAGVISGSAVVQRVAAHLGQGRAMEDAVEGFARELKQATRVPRLDPRR